MIIRKVFLLIFILVIFVSCRNVVITQDGKMYEVEGSNPYYTEWNEKEQKFKERKDIKPPKVIENEVINKVGVYQ